MSRKSYKWIVPEEIPSPIARKRTEYDECIEEFLKSGLESVRVNIPNTNPKTLSSQLSSRRKAKGLKNKVAVCCRKDKVYLVRVKS